MSFPARALVLGGAGFLGRHLVAALRERGAQAVVVDRRRDEATRGVTADVSSLDLRKFLNQVAPEVIFHLANPSAVPSSFEDPAADLRGTVETTVRVLEAIRAGPSRPGLVYVSSAAVYGESRALPIAESHPRRPVSPHGVAKLAAEEYVRLFAESLATPAIVVRPFSLYGPGQRKLVIHDLTRRLLGGEDPLMIDAEPSISRDFVWVMDGARALIRLAESAPLRGEAYNVASGRETTLEELAGELVRLTGASAEVEFTGRLRRGDPRRWVGDPAKARRLGVSCSTPLSDGLARTVEWLRRQR